MLGLQDLIPFAGARVHQLHDHFASCVGHETNHQAANGCCHDLRCRLAVLRALFQPYGTFAASHGFSGLSA